VVTANLILVAIFIAGGVLIVATSRSAAEQIGRDLTTHLDRPQR
jgi:hypothetical protein